MLNAGLAFALCFADKLPTRCKFFYAAAGCVCSLVIGGGHQVAGLLNVLVLLFAAALCAVRRRNFWQAPALAAAIAGLLLNVLAPGTQVRTAGFAGAGFAEAVVKSFILAAMEWIRWLDVPLLCLLALLVLPLLHLTRSAVLSDRVFRHPWLGAGVTFVLMWAMIFLPSYTMGGIGAGRLLNVVWMTFVLGLAATEFLLLGWLERVRGVSLHGAEQFCCRQARRLPRAYPFSLRCMGDFRTKYAMIGMAYVAGEYPLYYDAVNEKGLGIAGLNFVGNAVYHPAQDGKSNVAQFELIPWLLGSCATLAEVRTLLAKTNIVNIPFSEQLPLAQLHWLIADKTGSIVVESTADGLHIYDNPVGVLTNNPPFPQQLFALNNYRALSPRTPAVAFADGLDLPVYSRGLGALGLPGDLSSQSRFVRAAFVPYVE